MIFTKSSEIDYKFLILCFSWAIPTLFFITNPGYNPYSFPTWFAIAVSICLIFKKKEYFTYSIPFVALLSPISQKTLNVIPSEIFILLFFSFGLITVLYRGSTVFKIVPSDKYLLGMLVCILVSYILSFEYDILFKGMMRWIMLITVYILTRKTIQSDYQINKFLITIIIVSFYSSLITLVSWLEGVNLADFMYYEDDLKIINNKEDLTWYFRAQYFYANIAYIISPALILSFVKFRYSQKKLLKTIYFTAFTFFFVVLLLMNEKTGILSVGITLFLLNFFIQSPVQIKGFVNKIFFMIIITFFSSLIIYQIFKISDYYSLSTGSFSERICVIKNMVTTMFQHPLHLFFGFGPDASNLLRNEIIDAAKLNCDGVLQGAIDSGWFTFLFEYGIIFFLLFLAFNIHNIKNILNVNKKTHFKNIIVMSMLALLFYVNTAALSDVIGLGKVGWIISQYYALANIFVSQKSMI